MSRTDYIGKQRDQPTTMQQGVLSALRESIVNGQLAPGTLVRQEALAGQFGLSRVPVREALKILEGEGYVTSEPHRGYSIASPTHGELAELARVRELLLAEAVRVAIAASADLSLIREAARALPPSGGDGRAVRNVHLAIVQMAGLTRTMRLVEQLWDFLDAFGPREAAIGGMAADVDDARALVGAIEAGDMGSALAALESSRVRAVRSVEAQA